MKAWQDFSLECAHRLELEEPMLHGHTYTVRIWAEGEGDYVMRQAVMQAHAERVRNALDHKFLNDIMPVPTSENIARYILEMLREHGITKVQVIRQSIGFGVEAEA